MSFAIDCQGGGSAPAEPKPSPQPMKGIIFTEFLELVESKFGLDMVDDLIAACDLPSRGEYTAVGTYDHREIVDLVVELSRRTELPVPDLLQVYGEHLFGRFTVLYPQFFAGVVDGFQFLENVEGYIHVEVKKLYPSAELPTFDHERIADDRLRLVYHSSRHLEDVAEGLIRGCMKHFGSGCEITREGADSAAGGIAFIVARSPAP